MFRTLNAEKVKLLKANKREVVGTTLFVVLLGAAMVFIAFAGHI
jgi:preprotein translocase subunit SecE